MSGELIIHRVGSVATVQDMGRPGYLEFGLSRGGAADRLAIAEGAALLGQSEMLAALEMVGMGGEFEATRDLRIALTGAPMDAVIGDTRLQWNASHLLPAGERLFIGAVETGVYGYLNIGGGFAMQRLMGSQSVHLTAGIGKPVTSGQCLALGADKTSRTGMKLVVESRFAGGIIRVVPSLQTDNFTTCDLERFQATEFRRDNRGNRMGIRLVSQGGAFHITTDLDVLSEVIVPGDIQITGDGTPYVLLSECQTTGGYPRIGSVLPCDLPRVAQSKPGTILRFNFVSLATAIEIEQRCASTLHDLQRRVAPMIRDPHHISDLSSYQLIGGVTAGDDLDCEKF